jgi:hypothetical protein
MATLATANLPSDDEEDIDFVPDEVDSEDEASQRAKGGKQTKKSKQKRRRGVAAAPVDASEDEDEEDEDESGREQQEPEHKRAEKKAKMNELWSKLNQQQPGKRPPADKARRTEQSSPLNKKQQESKDAQWMRQLGLASRGSTATATNGKDKQPAKDTKAVAAAALAAAQTAASAAAARQYGMVTVSETRRFAGKTITVNREVAAGSKEAAKAMAGGTSAAGGSNGTGPSSNADAVAAKKAGLDAVLESLTQAKKVTVLDKSRLDWKDFKKTDKDVEEELEVHKRSGATYLEKKEFLGRAELAEYEKERDRRLASDVRNRGRL